MLDFFILNLKLNYMRLERSQGNPDDQFNVLILKLFDLIFFKLEFKIKLYKSCIDITLLT